MPSRSRRMPFTYSLILSVVALTTATRADTPFFWDDFDRESLDGGDVDWRLVSGEAYLQDGSLFMMLSDSNRATAAAASPLVGDFTVRTQISFAGAEAAGGSPWIGILAPYSAENVKGVVDSRLNWGGVQPSGIAIRRYILIRCQCKPLNGKRFLLLPRCMKEIFTCNSMRSEVRLEYALGLLEKKSLPSHNLRCNRLCSTEANLQLT